MAFNRMVMIEFKPDMAEAYWIRGIVKAAMGDLDATLGDYNKAIEMNPHLSPAFYSRGCLHYNRHQWTDALSDFERSLKAASKADYARFRILLVRFRLGEQEVAINELKQYLNTRKGCAPDDWPAKVGLFLTDQLTETGFLNAAKNADKKKENERHCEAYFYIGAKQFIKSNKTGAVECFHKCISTGVAHFGEYNSAKAELELL
jgi:lipoprotein NlpI